MAFSDSIFSITRSLNYSVKINGVPITPSNPTAATGVPGANLVRITKSLASPVPICAISVNRIPSWIRRGHKVEVDIGYDGYYQRKFTGYVQSRARGVTVSTIVCAGTLYSAFRTIQIAERDVDGMTVQAAIESVLDDVGITDRLINVPSFTLGTASDPVLERMTASQMLQMLMDIDGCRIYELGNGQAVIRVFEEQPAPTAFRTYTTDTVATARVLDGSDREDPEYLRTQVTVQGATIASGTPPNDVSTTLQATATLIGGDLVQPPFPSTSDQVIDTEYSNHLIDTSAKVAEVAQRLLTRFARVPRYLRVALPGDPQLELTQTLALEFSEMDVTGRWFISGLEEVIDEQGYRTTVDLRGGDEFGGTVGINPIAAFIATVEAEVIGSAVQRVVTFDASNSFDPDGTIASYAWSDNQSTTPEIATLTTQVVTVRADTSAWTGDWDVTLVVTDDDGLTGTVTITVPYSITASAVKLPAIFAAMNNNASATPDGGQNWNDESGSTCVSCAAKRPDGVNSGIGWFGFTGGAIKKTTNFAIDLTTVLAADAANGTINHIWPDANDARRVWACTSTGRLLRSIDDGDNWTVYKDFGGTYALNRIGTPLNGGVWVFGGRGDQTGTLIQFDKDLNGSWQSVPIGGHLATDLVGASSSVTIAEAASKVAGELAIIFKGAALPGGISIFYTTTVHDSAGAGWARAAGTGLSSVSDGRYIVPDFSGPGVFHAAFGDRHIWSTTDGINYTKTADVMPTGVTPNHCIFIGEFLGGLSGVYLVAAEDSGGTVGIYKSTDALATVNALRPATGFPAWPASAKAKMVAIGAGSVSSNASILYTAQGARNTTTYGRRVARLNGGVVWEARANPSAASQTMTVRLRRFAGVMFRITANHTPSSPYAQAPGQLQRSTDDGATWSNVGPSPAGAGTNDNWGVNDICSGADGTLYLIASEYVASSTAGYEPEVHRSTDGGATWSQIFQETTLSSGNFLSFTSITAHPSNKNIVAVVGNNAIGQCRSWHSVDATAVSPTFTLHTGGAGTTSALGRRALLLQSGRMVQMSGNTSVTQWYSDDYGATAWVQATGDALGNTGRDICRTSGDVVFVVGAETSSQGQILRSTDQGVSYTAIWSDSSANIDEVAGAVYQDVDATLYFCTQTAAAIDRVFSLPGAATESAPTAHDLTYGLDAIFTEASTAGAIAVQGICA